MDPWDPFENLIEIFCNVRADWEVKKGALFAIGKLVDAEPDSQLPEKVAVSITDPIETWKREAELQHLREEVERSKTEVFVFKEKKAATREMAAKVRKIVEQVKATLEESGMAAAKAKLFEERVHEDKKLSGTRMIRIFTDFAEQVETTMLKARKAADQMEESSRKLTWKSQSKGINLLDLSLPEMFPDEVVSKVGKDWTLESKKVR